MEFQIQKKVEGDVYTIEFIKNLIDINNISVKVIDKSEDVTVKQLEEKKEGLFQQINNLNEQIKELDSWILSIKEL